MMDEFDDFRTYEAEEEDVWEDEDDSPPGIYVGLDEVGLPRYYNAPGWGLHMDRW